MGSSNSFGSKRPAHPHLVEGPGGLASEINDLRRDVDEAFTTVESLIAGDVFASLYTPVIPVQATDDDGILLVTASIIAPTTYLGSANGFTGLLAPAAAGNAVISCSKRIVITTAGGAGAGDWTGGNVTVTGTDADGVAQIEAITTVGGAQTKTGSKYFATVSSIALPANTGIGATVMIGVAPEVACIANGVSSAVAQLLYVNADFNRDRIGNRSMSIARKLVLVLSLNAGWDATSMTVTGLDINGGAIAEAIAIPNGGNATVIGAKFFAQVTSIAIPPQSAVDPGTFTLGMSDTVLGLPKLKIPGAIVAVALKELTRADSDSTTAWTVAVAGTLTEPALALPNGAYTPNTQPDGASGRILMYFPQP